MSRLLLPQVSPRSRPRNGNKTVPRLVRTPVRIRGLHFVVRLPRSRAVSAFAFGGRSSPKPFNSLCVTTCLATHPLPQRGYFRRGSWSGLCMQLRQERATLVVMCSLPFSDRCLPSPLRASQGCEVCGTRNTTRLFPPKLAFPFSPNCSAWKQKTACDNHGLFFAHAAIRSREERRATAGARPR